MDSILGNIKTMEEDQSLYGMQLKYLFGVTNKLVSQTPSRFVSDESEFSLLPSQYRLWFLDQHMKQKAGCYNKMQAIQLCGKLNAELFEQALKYVAKQHEALHTNFITVGNLPRQKVHKHLSINLLSETIVEGKLQEILEKYLNYRFDLQSESLIKFSLLKLNNEKYIFVMVAHHIICDDYSLDAFFTELMTEYSTHNRYKPKTVSNYAGAIEFQNEQLKESKLTRHIDFWHKTLADYPILNLPTDYQRASNWSNRSNYLNIEFNKEITARLKNVAKQNNVTLYIVLLTALNILLSKYTNQEDIIIGSRINNRLLTNFANVLGQFSNIVLLRNCFSSACTLRDFLLQVNENAIAAIQHSIVPYELLINKFCKERDLNRSPLCQIMLNLQPQKSFNDFALTQLKIEKICNRENLIGLDMAFFLEETENGLQGCLEYNSSLFEQQTIQRFSKNFAKLLSEFSHCLDVPLYEIPVLDDAEKNYLLLHLNDTARNYAKDICIQQLFEEQVIKQPHQVALIYENKQLTYAELNRKANQLAHYLIKLGVGKNSVIALSMHRSLELVISLLAIFKAGATYIGLEPNYPDERLQFMLEDSNSSILITDTSLRDKFSSYSGKTIFFDECLSQIENESVENLAIAATPYDHAFIFYTSGSTGKPKGVISNHFYILNRIRWMWEKFPYEKNEMGCLKTALSSAPSLLDIFQPLLYGIPLVVLPQDILHAPHEMVHLLAKYSVTRLGVVPSLLRILLEQNPDLNKKLPHLKFWEIGGEATSPELAQLFANTLPEAKLVNRYGATEVMAAISYDISNHDTKLNTIPIGNPIANTKIYVLDKYMQLTPFGAVGELWINSIGLSEGYINRPELTDKVFVNNPFAANQNSEIRLPDRIYKTGDLVRWLSNGVLEYVGRQDHQINMRGFRVELGEIESALVSHPAIAQCIVTAEGENENKYLIAYFVGKANSTVPTSEQLQLYLSNKLMDYMIPAVFVPLEKFPRLPNGKLDRKSLPTVNNNYYSKKYIPPRDNVERKMLKLWQKIFGLQEISMADDFFVLGGNSLLAIMLMHDIYTEFNTRLPVSLLFTHKSIESLSIIIKQQDPQQIYYQPLIKITNNNSTKYVFFAPPAGGSPFRYHKLQKYLSDEFIFFGLESPNLHPHAKKLTTVEDMATFYLEEITKIQPKGPYYLGGWSHGGLVALEMVHRLQERNERVALLFMIDTLAPTGKLKNIADSVDEEQLGQILIKSNVFPASCDPERIKLMVQSFKIASQSAKAYKPKIYNGDLILLRASDPTDDDAPGELFGGEDRAEYNGWKTYITGNIEEHLVPGTHNNLMLEGAESIANHINQALLGHEQFIKEKKIDELVTN